MVAPCLGTVAGSCEDAVGCTVMGEEELTFLLVHGAGIDEAGSVEEGQRDGLVAHCRFLWGV
ncbi:MAG: hypothetical protein D6729_00380 [Deltaproteobacteria bacterium]|nr:MAG: hypothetical protein D6729_00380 [Deltaproteobacteria bacterium]